MDEDECGDEDFVWNRECPVAGHTGAVLSVAFSPEGTRVVSGSQDCLVNIWDTKTQAEVRIFVGLRGVW